MKRLLKIILILCTALVVMAFGARASGNESVEYIITSEGEDYLLSRYTSDGPTPILRSSDFLDITEYISSFSSISSTIIFSGIEVFENINIFDGSYTLSGSLTLVGGASLSIDSSSVFISQMTLKTDGGGIRLKRGSLAVDDSKIEGKNGSAIVLDYSAEACLSVKNGSVITCESKNSAIDVKLGSALISSGEIRNSGGPAIVNKSTLTLSGSPIIEGREFDIVTENPISLSYGKEFYSGSAAIKYSDNFEEGTVSCVFYSASEDSLKNIKFYDISGEKKSLSFFDGTDGFSEKNFGAVYLPYYVNFYVDSSLVKRVDALRGKSVSTESAIEKEGYEFIGWSTAYGEALIYDFAKEVDKSFDLYACYKLKSPSFSVSSLTFDYDGKEHALSVNSLEHPLVNSAIINYTWYKDDVAIGYGREIKLKSVSESGKYSCKIDFTYGTDSVSVFTPKVDVVINKAVIEIPIAEDKYYNGEFQTSGIYSTAVYTVSESGGAVVGNYPVEIRLCDSGNYVFSNGSEIARIEFKILKAKNYWLDEPIIYDVYEGNSPSPISLSRFGSAIYLYSDKFDGVFTESIPRDAGEYYCIAKVGATDNFEELVSSPIKFFVIEEKLTGISIYSMPNISDYTAFQKFIADGLILSVMYNSGRTEKISADKISFSYQSADSFRYNDTAVIASYLDRAIAVPVNVSKAKYDVSGIIFSDSAAVYDGIGKTIEYRGVLPVGIDGIPLECTVIGGGINSGVYTLTLSFKTKSKNYTLPSAMTANLTILPYESNVVFLEKEFVYDGALKCPKAYYTDIYGRKVELNVSGAHSLAGEYEAIAVSNDNNYKLVGSSIIYKIKKASYNFDNVSWTDSDFVYDGTEKRVEISGLPIGVSVVGYSDNKAVNAGVYTAKVLLTYDEKNYNPPEELSYTWTIRKADYDLSGFYFTDITLVYNGSLQYPKFSGVMPCGVDGIFLEYEFERGVLNVSEGKSAVNILYSTKSKNYNVPESSCAYVEILPLGITVGWSNFEFTYDTALHMPSASATECGISVLGGKRDAGEYTATAISLDSNYYVINPTVKFVINKAENVWTSILRIEDIFEGRNLSPHAEAFAGDVYYEYYSDALCENKIDAPMLPGKFYVVAVTYGNTNYSPLKSPPIEFEIKKIIPVGILVSLTENTFSAFDIIDGESIFLLLENNDGSLTEVEPEKVIIKYQNADSLRFGDSYITVSYLGFTKEIAVSVSKAEYDMSGVRWSASEFIYDGEEKKIILTGLPAGVNVISYFGASATLAGEYLAYAELSYDSDNYNKPSVPSGTFVIKKQTVIPPIAESAEYSGKEYLPIIKSSDLYTVFSTPSTGVGKYYVTLTLTDSSNYEFPNLSSEISLEYEIIPKKLTVEISDIDKYWLGKMTEPSFVITEGESIEGEDLIPIFIYGDDYVSCKFNDSNYSVTVIPGEIIKHNSLSENDLFKAFVLFLLFVLLMLLILVLVLRRKEIARYVSVIKCRLSPVSKTVNSLDSNVRFETSKTVESVQNDTVNEKIGNVESALSVDRDRADSLITDSLAKNLVRKDDVRIYTEGKKKRIINVDTLSDNFLSGERVDVNKLKEMSLVPYDTAYIKVLARGMIDKPLKVYANDFSLSAVKMIALTGGEAIKVVTVRKKKDGSEDSTQ